MSDDYEAAKNTVVLSFAQYQRLMAIEKAAREFEKIAPPTARDVGVAQNRRLKALRAALAAESSREGPAPGDGK